MKNLNDFQTAAISTDQTKQVQGGALPEETIYIFVTSKAEPALLL